MVNTSTKVLIILHLYIFLTLILKCYVRADNNNLDFNNPVRTAQEDEISSLPDLNYTLNFKQYSGYLVADNEKPTNRFWHYWFVESQSNPANDPLVFWFSGGPGCSSLMPLITEIGPFKFEDGRLNENPFTWNRKANMIFIESPAGVGYSYAVNGDITSDDDTTAQQNYKALQSFMLKFPKYKNNFLYLSGSSYAGVYLPTLGVLLDEDKEFNLKGLIIGNGLLDANSMGDAVILFFYHYGLFSPNMADDLSIECCDGKPLTRGQCGFFNVNRTNECAKLVEAVYDMPKAGLNVYNIYQPCIQGTKRNMMEKEQKDEELKDEHEYFCYEIESVYKTIEYINSKELRKAINIPDNFEQVFKPCTKLEYTKIYPNQWGGLTNQFKSLLASSRGLEILIYNGDLDAVCNHLSSQWFVEDLKQKVLVEHHPWFLDGQLAGFRRIYEGITYMTVKGGGHMVPYDKPAEAQELFESFLYLNQPLE